MADPKDIIEILDEMAGEGELTPENQKLLDNYLANNGPSDLPQEYQGIANNYLGDNKYYTQTEQQTGSVITSENTTAAREMGQLANQTFRDDLGNSATVKPESFGATSYEAVCSNGEQLDSNTIKAIVDQIKESGNDAGILQGLTGEEQYEFPDGPNPIAAACDKSAAESHTR